MHISLFFSIQLVVARGIV